MPAVAQTVSILDTDDLDDLFGRFNLAGAHFAEADVPDLALLMHLLQRAEGLLERSARIDAVQLVKVDALQLEPTQAHLHALDQVARATHIFRFSRPLPRDSAFGRDHQAVRIRVERLGDQPFGNLRPVSVGSIDQVDAQFDGVAQNAARFARILRFAPGSIADKAHRSIPEPVHGQVAVNLESAAHRGGRQFGSHRTC